MQQTKWRACCSLWEITLTTPKANRHGDAGQTIIYRTIYSSQRSEYLCPMFINKVAESFFLFFFPFFGTISFHSLYCANSLGVLHRDACDLDHDLFQRDTKPNCNLANKRVVDPHKTSSVINRHWNVRFLNWKATTASTRHWACVFGHVEYKLHFMSNHRTVSDKIQELVFVILFCFIIAFI